MYIYVYIYVYTHIHTYVCIHTYIPKNVYWCTLKDNWCKLAAAEKPSFWCLVCPLPQMRSFRMFAVINTIYCLA